MWRQTAFVLLALAFLSAAHGDDNKQKPIPVGDNGDPKFDSQLLADKSKDDEAKSLRELIQVAVESNEKEHERDKSPKVISEISSLKENLLKSSPAGSFSLNLTAMLKEQPNKVGSPILGIGAAEAIADPNINVIDSHVSQVVQNSSVNDQRFQPDADEMKTIAKDRFQDTNFHNLYRENLLIKSIREEPDFRLGEGVQQWKSLSIRENLTALFGKSPNSIVVLTGHNQSYERLKLIVFDIPPHEQFHFEVLTIFDAKQNQARHLIVAALATQLLWFEMFENHVKEIHSWNFLKEIDSMVHFTHDGSEILLLITIDQEKRVQAEFIEFNVPDSEFWVIQAFRLPTCPPSVAYLDLGKEFVVAFAQQDNVTIFRHQYTKHLRGKFTLFKTIEAANVSSVSGFRIGGYSYLAIGGDQPQILRYTDGNFAQQTILSQTFGFVEDYLPVIVRTYRDDLILLVQHRLELATHALEVVDALIWNGIAFESALSVPCQISSDPNANGFTCMLDLERDSGLLGATAIHHEKENGLYFVIPRSEAHSGLFKVSYAIVEAEDPLLKDIEQMKKSIEFISKMLDYEETVKKDIEEALRISVNPNNDFNFDGLQIDEIQADFLEFSGVVTLSTDIVEFLNSNWTQDDFLVDLDQLEKTIQNDENRLKAIDAELNKLNRVNRQVQDPPTPLPNSPIHNVGSFAFNGQLDPKSIGDLMKMSKVQGGSRQRRQIDPIEQSRVSSLTVKNIDVETINGIPADTLIFLTNGQLVVPDSNVTFLNNVNAANVKMLDNGRINGVDFSDELLAVESINQANNLVFENLFVQSLEISVLNNIPVDEQSLNEIQIPLDMMPNLTAKNVFISHDLNITTINGIMWEEFVAKLVPTHFHSSIEDLTVEGNIFVVGPASELNVNRLNNLSFPDSFLLRNGRTESVITGKKTFENQLATTAIDTDGTINDIQPSSIITLDQNQNISAETTFKSLEVLKKLEVNGTIAGRQLNEFLPNPTLTESKIIVAACSFKELIVRGRVTIENSLNGQNLAAVLNDVVYETQDESAVVIAAPKIFTDLEVQGNVNISNNFINDLSLDKVVMTEGDQDLLLNELQGKVYFSNLKTSGFFDGINATELERNSVRTFGEQFIETPLFIIDGRVGAQSAEVKESLNLIPVGDFLSIDQPLDFSAFTAVNFAELEVRDLHLSSADTVGTGRLSSLNLTDISSNYLSKSRKQRIVSPVNITSLITNGTFASKTINNMEFDVFVNYMRGIKNFKNLILSGEQKLDNLFIDGNVKVKTINDQSFDEIVANAIWLNRPNTITSNLKFFDDVTVNGLILLNGNINKTPFKNWLDNWVSNKEKTISIHSGKIFESDVIVEEDLHADAVNGINFADLLMKKDVVRVPFLNILGNVNVNKLRVDRSLNQQTVKTLTDLYSYDAKTYAHTVNSDVHFSHPTTVNYLNSPVFNNLNVSAFFLNMIKVDENNVYISGEKIFSDQIVAQQGFFNEYINDIKTDFLDKVVLINDQNAIKNFEGSLAFVGDVHANLFGVKGDVFTRFISSCDTMEWTKIALKIDKNLLLDGTLHIKSSALKTSNLTTNFLNGIPFASIFTLGTNQKFDHEIKIIGSAVVKNPLIVRGNVNGLSLEYERENTVMLNQEHQEVTAKTTFGGARVSGNLTAYGKVNSKILQNAVLLNSSPTIESAVNFKSLEGTSLYSSDVISGTNFNKWYDNVLWARGKDDQKIFGSWEVKKLQLTNDATGNGLINDVSIHEIEKNLQSSIISIDAAISNHSQKYQELCRDLGTKANDSQSSIYILKHFELDYKISEKEDIFSYFAFETPTHENILAVNTNCTSRIYKWIQKEERFKDLASFDSGVVYDWLLVKNAKQDVFIITNSRMEANYPCKFGGLNVWKMNGDQLFHVSTISKETDILELRVNQQQPGRFYTLSSLDAVTHFDTFGDKKEFWQLPQDSNNYSFIPPEVTSDLTLYNGRNLYKLDSKFKIRNARFFDEELQRFSETNRIRGDTPIIRLPVIRKPDGAQNNLVVPSIPGKKLIGSDDNNDFVMRIRQIGDVVRKSLSDTFKDIPKLTIKNSGANNVLPDSKIFNIKPSSPLLKEVKEKSVTSPENIAVTQSSVTRETTSSTLATSVKPISAITNPMPSTTNKSTIDQNLTDPSSVSKSSLAVDGEQTPTHSPNPLIDTLKKVGSEIKSAYDAVTGAFVGTERSKTTEFNNDVFAEKSSFESSTESSSTQSESEKVKDSSTTLLTATEVKEHQTETTTEKLNSSALKLSHNLTPQIFLPPENSNETENLESPLRSTIFPDVFQVKQNEEDLEEQQVPLEILTGSGLRVTENTFIPEKGTGEFVMMYVGPRRQKQALFAVTRARDSKIKGNNNIIEIYYDVFEGSIYQYIPCSDPSNLVTLQFRDETLFAFLEGRHEIHVYIYRGVQGFIPFKRIELPAYANQMTSLTLPPKTSYKCDQHYLLVRMETDILFYGVKLSGNCGLSEVRCDSYY